MACRSTARTSWCRWTRASSAKRTCRCRPRGLPTEQALKRIRVVVSDATNRQQFPWESSSLTSEFSFFPTATSGRTTVASAGQQPSTSASSRSEARSVESWQKELKPRTAREAYEIVAREDKVKAYQAYLALYPSQSLAP